MKKPTAHMQHLVSEFDWTRPRHKGSVNAAAPILGMTPLSLARSLSRARKAGLTVEFVDDSKRARR